MTQETNKAKKADTDDILASLLENVPTSNEIAVDLPSKNKYYTLIDPAAPITIRAMTFKDEKAMVSNKNVDIDIINTLLSRCVSNISISQILLIDKLFLIMKIREVSYGDEYGATILCSSCRKNNNVKFNLAKLRVNYIPKGHTDPISTTLPILKKNIKIRLPRILDEQYLVNTDSTVTNLWRFIEEIEGHTSKQIISKVAENLPLQDAHKVLNVIGGDGLGIDTKVQFVCDYCSHAEVIQLPITSDFFTGN